MPFMEKEQKVDIDAVSYTHLTLQPATYVQNLPDSASVQTNTIFPHEKLLLLVGSFLKFTVLYPIESGSVSAD